MSTKPFVGANLALAFLLEVAAFAALGYGAYHLADETALGIVSAVVAVLLAAVLWGAFAAPRAKYRRPGAVLAVKVLVFVAGVVALIGNGHLLLGVILGVAIAGNAVALRGSGHGYLVGSEEHRAG